MKNLVIVLTAAFALSVSSCTKCYVCKDKTKDTFEKVEYCDKDFDKGDIDAIIEDMEDAGYVCHRSSRAI
jgi:hypothetical protein